MKVFFDLFGIAMPMLHDLTSRNVTITWYRLSRLKVCLSHTLYQGNNHLVSFIKVEGLFVSYIVAIFETIKSEMTV